MAFSQCAPALFPAPPAVGGAYAIRPYMYPAKLRCPRRGRPYHGDNHSSLRDVWGANAIRPYMYPANLAGIPDAPLHGYNHSSLRDVWGAYAIRPYTGTRKNLAHPVGG